MMHVAYHPLALLTSSTPFLSSPPLETIYHTVYIYIKSICPTQPKIYPPSPPLISCFTSSASTSASLASSATAGTSFTAPRR